MTSSPAFFQEAIAYWRYTSGRRAAVAVILCLAVTAGVLEALGLRAFHRLLTDAADSPRRELARFIGFAVFAVVSGHLAEELGWWLRSRIERELRLSLVDFFARIPWSRASRLHGSRLQRTFLVEGFEIALGLQSLIRGTVALVTLTGLLVVVSLSVPGFFGALTLGAVAFAVLGGTAGKRARSSFFQQGQLHRRLGRQLSETWSALKYCRATGDLGYFRRRLEGGIVEYAEMLRHCRLQQPRLALGFRLLVLAAMGLGLVAVLPSGGAAGLEAWFVPVAALYRLIPHALIAHREIQHARNAFHWLVSYEELAAAASSGPEGHPVRPARFQSAVELDRVTFRHGPDREPVLREVSLRIPYGGTVGITGPSGSGKSTLVDLVTGLLEPQGGELRLDGVPYGELDLAGWRSRIGLVLQEPMLFDGTIRENILWDRPEDPRRLREAAEKAGVWEFVERLPAGWDTPLGERGGLLSGGQRQRLAIARALYREPWLLILDEPTSSLDAAARAGILRLVASLRGQVTLVGLGHDFGLLGLCERRYRLEDGRLRPLAELGEPLLPPLRESELLGPGCQ